MARKSRSTSTIDVLCTALPLGASDPTTAARWAPVWSLTAMLASSSVPMHIDSSTRCALGGWKAAKMSVASLPACEKITFPPAAVSTWAPIRVGGAAAAVPGWLYWVMSYTLLRTTSHAFFGLLCAATSLRLILRSRWTPLECGCSPPMPITRRAGSSIQVCWHDPHPHPHQGACAWNSLAGIRAALRTARATPRPAGPRNRLPVQEEGRAIASEVRRRAPWPPRSAHVVACCWPASVCAPFLRRARHWPARSPRSAMRPPCISATDARTRRAPGRALPTLVHRWTPLRRPPRGAHRPPTGTCRAAGHPMDSTCSPQARMECLIRPGCPPASATRQASQCRACRAGRPWPPAPAVPTVHPAPWL